MKKILFVMFIALQALSIKSNATSILCKGDHYGFEANVKITGIENFETSTRITRPSVKEYEVTIIDSNSDKIVYYSKSLKKDIYGFINSKYEAPMSSSYKILVEGEDTYIKMQNNEEGYIAFRTSTDKFASGIFEIDCDVE
jgi:hypothetical protein